MPQTSLINVMLNKEARQKGPVRSVIQFERNTQKEETQQESYRRPG